MHVLGDAGAVVEHAGVAAVPLAGGGDVDVPGAGVTRVAEHLDERVLHAPDVMLCLTALGLGDAEPDEALAEALLDAEGAVPAHGGDETSEV